MGTPAQANLLPAGLSATVTAQAGVSFIAATTTVTGTGTVYATASAGIGNIEVIGDANNMTSNGANVLGSGTGQQFILACYQDGVLTAPANNSVLGLWFALNNSAQGV
jgi:hypothetical protein